MARLIRSFDWASTPLGPLNVWPQSLKTATGLLIASPVPMVMLWGPDGVMIYNDAYSIFAGGRHPRLLGSKVREGWPEVADFNDNVMKVGLAGGTLAYQDQELTLHRSGKPEQVWMNLDYSPVPDESGRPAGVLAVVVETTERVRSEASLRESEARLRFFDELAQATAGLSDADSLLAVTTRKVAEKLGVSNCAYADMDEDQDGFTIRGDWAAPGSPSIVGHYSLADFGVLAVKNLGAGLPLVVNDNLRELAPEEAATFQNIGIAATICMPLVKNGRLTALMAIHDKVPHAWSANEQAVIREVTERCWAHIERVRAEAGTRAGEARFRAFAQAMPNHAWTATPDGQLDWFNDRVYDYSGAKPGDLDGEKWASLVHPDDLKNAAAHWGDSVATGKTYETEFRIRRADGRYRWHIVRALPLRDSAGRVTIWTGTNTDIEEQKLTAEALEHLNHTLEQRVEERTRERDRMWTLAEDMLARADYEGKMSAVNPAWTKILGWSEHELLTNPYADIIHPENIETVVAALTRMGETGQPTRFENRILGKDGVWRAIGWTVSPEPDGVNFIAIGRDLTEDKAREEELAAAQEALRQSQKMEAVGQLTGGIAHDFNNLLAGIGGSLELIETRLADGQTEGLQRYIDGAQSSTRRAAALTQRLLAFSRRQTLDPKPTDMNRLASGMEDLIRRTVGPAIEIEVVGAGGLWLTNVDQPQLESALLNLAINARDAMPEGGRITIETANKWLDERAAKDREVPPGQYVSLCVTDTGTGMTPEIISRAFDPFFTTKPLGQGTGLGLSMIHGFVRQSGGQVRVYSEVGKGTTMCLYLPRFLGEIEVGEVSEAEPAPESGHGETVLIIDDEFLVRMLMADVVEEAGYRVVEAHDGPSGLKILQSDARIDLLITDVGLPGGMNGRQVADAARATRPDLKVLFVTGYAENAVVGNGHLDPGMQVLTKPFEMTALAARVNELITGVK